MLLYFLPGITPPLTSGQPIAAQASPSHSAHCSFEETHPRETDTQSLACKLCPSSSPRARCPQPLGLQCAVRTSVTAQLTPLQGDTRGRSPVLPHLPYAPRAQATAWHFLCQAPHEALPPESRVVQCTALQPRVPNGSRGQGTATALEITALCSPAPPLLCSLMAAGVL